MLTKDLLLFRSRKGQVRPSFVDPDKAEILGLAEDLVAVLGGALGDRQEELEEAFAGVVAGFPRLKLAKGLVKIALDRCTFEQPEAEVGERRFDAFARAAATLRALDPAAAVEDYERALAVSVSPLEEVRTALYADLPGRRRVLAVDPIDARGLVDRYNTALAQGLVMSARRLELIVHEPELRSVRRVLRWLKFCRLVAEVHKEPNAWRLEVEGPAAMFDHAKSYGLQLARFLGVVPILERFTLRAVVELERRSPMTLELTQKDPLRSPHAGPLGHVPEEIARVGELFGESEWRVETAPEPRNVGVRDLCVPDFAFARGDRTVYLELFHRWHRHSLGRRLDGLAARPDPDLLLGVDRALLKREPALADTIEANPQVVLFTDFPTPRALRAALKRFE